MQLLHLDSSILGEGSASRAISAAIVERIREMHPDIDVLYRDLVAEPIPHMTFEAFMALDTGEEVQQFLDADIVVISKQIEARMASTMEPRTGLPEAEPTR